MKTISVLPNEAEMQSICAMFLENVISNVAQRKDENGQIEWGKRDAYALVSGALNCFKVLSSDKQEELVEYFEKYSK